MVKNLLFLVEILSDSWADMERIQKDVDGLKLHKKKTVDQVWLKDSEVMLSEHLFPVFFRTVTPKTQPHISSLICSYFHFKTW